MNRVMDRSLQVLSTASALAERLDSLRPQLRESLKAYETLRTFDDEITRATNTLRGLRREGPEFNFRIADVATFLPINLPIYSYVLYCVVPALLADRVEARAPMVARSVFEQIHKLLDPNGDLNICFHESTRAKFLYKIARKCRAVLFCGRYENAERVSSVLRDDQLFVFNGYGINPFIINPTADVEFASSKAVWSRTYNSGQDCAGPDIFFVHDAVLSRFLHALERKLSKLVVGPNDMPDTDVGPLTDYEAFARAKQYLAGRRDQVMLGGFAEPRTIKPTVLIGGLTDAISAPELFSPVFNVIPYAHSGDLNQFLSSDRYRQHSMYLSIFGETEVKWPGGSVILENKCVLDVDDGNHPFGGYGIGASHVRLEGVTTPQPVLISAALRSFAAVR